MRQLTFPENYFNEETVDDFTISAMMKHAWAAQVEVLYTVIQLCEKHNINYYADWGTLLGTIRHKGFIPWDDDLDISMKRKDYLKFLAVASTELPESYDILNMYTEQMYDGSFMRVVNGKSIHTGQEWMDEFHGCPYVVGVDIFPIDYIPRNKEDARVQYELIKNVYMIVNLLPEKDNLEKIVRLIHQVEAACQVKIDWNQSVKNQLLRLADNLSGIFTEEESDKLTNFAELFGNPEKVYPKEWFDHTILLPFETIEIRVPAEYDKILTVEYGDYMTPTRGTQDHDYPFYKKQQKVLLENMKQVGDSRTLEEMIAPYKY